VGEEGQIVADFIVDHIVTFIEESCVVELSPWKLFFDDSVCSRGRALDVSLCHLTTCTLMSQLD
jgi:hypothetical protein